MESVILEFEPGRVYADQTRFGDLVLTIRHLLNPVPSGGTQVTHTLDPELGPQISGDFPVAMAELLAVAERR